MVLSILSLVTKPTLSFLRFLSIVDYLALLRFVNSVFKRATSRRFARIEAGLSSGVTAWLNSRRFNSAESSLILLTRSSVTNWRISSWFIFLFAPIVLSLMVILNLLFTILQLHHDE